MRLIEFDARMDRLTYPTTTEAIVEEFGTTHIEFGDGTERVDRVLGAFGSETYASEDELRMSLYGALPEAAVGRKGYSDRDPPAIGEFEPVSF